MGLGQWCPWHVLIVTGTVEEDDREVVVMHPECGFTYTTDPECGGSFSYHCEIQYEIDNCGFDTLLNDNPEPGWYRARMQHYVIRGLDWSEIDVDHEVEPLNVKVEAPF